MAAASGVTVQDSAVTAFNEIKLNKKSDYLIFKITDDKKEIELEAAPHRSAGDRVEDCSRIFEEFSSKMPAGDCRYGIFDFFFDKGEAGKRTCLIFFVWCPDNAPVRQKMLYASSKDALKKKLVGHSFEIQAADLDDLRFASILKTAQEKK